MSTIKLANATNVARINAEIAAGAFYTCWPRDLPGWIEVARVELDPTSRGNVVRVTSKGGKVGHIGLSEVTPDRRMSVAMVKARMRPLRNDYAVNLQPAPKRGNPQRLLELIASDGEVAA